MLLLEVGRLAPERLLLRVHVERVGVDGPRRRDVALARHRLGVVEPDGLPVLLVDVEVDARLDDGLRRHRAALALCALGLGEPLLARELGAVLLERRHAVGNDGVDLADVALLLLEAPGGDPDLVRRRDRLARLVEDLARAVGRLEAREREPQLLRVRDDLDGAREEDPCVLGVVLELDRLLPQLDRRRDVLEGCARRGEGEKGRRRAASQSRSRGACVDDEDGQEEVDAPLRRTRFLALTSVSSSTARIQIRTDCGSSWTALARMTLAFSGVCAQARQNDPPSASRTGARARRRRRGRERAGDAR